MGRHGYSLIQLFLVVICSTVMSGAQADDGPSGNDVACLAEQAYLKQQNKLQGNSYSTSRDYSCLVDFPSLSDPSEYQLVDVRKVQSPTSLVPDVWHLSINELRHNQSLKNKQLLLLTDGFSRVQAAENCARLKSAGYADINILVGGADAWMANTGRRYINTHSGQKLISPQKMIYEYLNGNLVLVAGSDTVAQYLNDLGFDDVYTAPPDDGTAKLLEIITDSSGGGYYPVVMVGDESFSAAATPVEAHNLYVLDSPAYSIERELAKNQWINAKRNSVPRRYLCGRS